MKLIIDISEEEYKEVLEDTYSGTPFENKIFTIIANGTPYEEEERPHGEWIKKVDDVPCEECPCYEEKEVNTELHLPGLVMTSEEIKAISGHGCGIRRWLERRKVKNGQLNSSSDRSDA